MDRQSQDREGTIAEIARLLPARNGQLGRLLWRHAKGPLHRGMASVLATLGNGSETIGRLAEREGVAQPTLTRETVARCPRSCPLRLRIAIGTVRRRSVSRRLS